MKFDFFLNKEIKKVLAKQQRQKHFLNLDGMRNVLILFNIEDWDDISIVISDLKNLDKNVQAWTIQPKLSKQEHAKANSGRFPREVRVIDTNTEVSWKKTLEDSVISEFERADYDTLIDLTSEDNPYLLYLLAKNTSSFCLGIKESDYKMYDFVILKDEEQSIFETYRQIKFYLGKIRENTNNS